MSRHHTTHTGTAVLHEIRKFVYFIGMKRKKASYPVKSAGTANSNRALLQQALDSGLSHPLSGLFDFLPDVYFFVKNRQSQFVNANLGFVEMLGAHSLQDIIGRTDHDFSPAELADHFVRDDRTVMRTGKSIANRMELVPNSDGSISWHLTSKVPIRDAKGTVIGLAGITRDLSKASISLNRYGAMSAVMEHIERRYHEPVTVEELAELVHLSVSQFERRFKNLFQVTPMKYLVRYRISRACQLLVNGNTKITGIAAETGFYDHSHFIRQFTNAVGISPSEYRRRHTQIQPHTS